MSWQCQVCEMNITTDTPYKSYYVAGNRIDIHDSCALELVNQVMKLELKAPEKIIKPITVEINETNIME